MEQSDILKLGDAKKYCSRTIDRLVRKYYERSCL